MTPSQKRIIDKISTWERVTVEVHVHEYGNVTAFVIPETTGTMLDLANRMACLHIGKRGKVDGNISLRDGTEILFDAKSLHSAHTYTGATCDFHR